LHPPIVHRSPEPRHRRSGRLGPGGMTRWVQ
jgi:hypothetical protein